MARGVCATQNVADTDTAITVVDALIQYAEFPFHFTPAVESNEYMFTITAAGKYVVDWGDGTGECIDKTDVNDQIISHTYASPAKIYRIGFGGKTTGYIRWGNMAKSVIYFGDESSRLSSIDGCVGCVFSTITDANGNILNQGGLGGQQSFAHMFSGNSELGGEIPPNLFAGIHGALLNYMFECTFEGCSGPTGSIPENLFAGIDSTADAVDRMFDNTFGGCTGLTGYSPKIDGKYLYEIWPSYKSRAYRQCTGLADYADMPAEWR